MIRYPAEEWLEAIAPERRDQVGWPPGPYMPDVTAAACDRFCVLAFAYRGRRYVLRYPGTVHDPVHVDANVDANGVVRTGIHRDEIAQTERPASTK